MLDETTDQAVNNGSRAAGWARRQLTIPNVLILVMFVVWMSGWVKVKDQADETLVSRVAAIEDEHKEFARETAATYVRRDVIEERLKSIDQRLEEIGKAIKR
jgi:hypothetical protein